MYTYANISLQRESRLAEAQIGARFVDACAVDAGRIGAFVDICKTNRWGNEGNERDRSILNERNPPKHVLFSR